MSAIIVLTYNNTTQNSFSFENIVQNRFSNSMQ